MLITLAVVVVAVIILIVFGVIWRQTQKKQGAAVYRILSGGNGTTLQWHTGAWVLAQQPGAGDLVTLGPNKELFDYPSGHVLVPPSQAFGENRVNLLPPKPGQICIVNDDLGHLILPNTGIWPNAGIALGGNTTSPILYDIRVSDNKWILVAAK